VHRDDDHPQPTEHRRAIRWRWTVASAAGLLACLAGGAAYGLQSTADARTDLATVAVNPASARSMEASIAAKADREQAATLAAGTISANTYLTAKRAAAVCVEQQLAAQAGATGQTLSVTVVGPTLSPDGYQADYSYRVEGSPAALASASVAARGAADQACQQRYSEAVEQVYHLQRQSDSTWVKQANDGFDRCVASRSPGATAPTDARAYLLDHIRAAAAAHPATAGHPLANGDGLSRGDQACLGRYPSIASQPTASTGS
jgi:hypothetical protein